MLDALWIYGRYLQASIRAQMQYRASFILLSLGNLLVTATEFIALWALFERFGMLHNWTLPEAGLFYGIVHVSFALAEGLGRGFDSFALQVRSGEFDRILVRPRTTALQIAARECQLLRIGRLAQGMLVLLWSTMHLELIWRWWHLPFLAVTVVSCTCLFIGLFVIQATICFWTTEPLEIMNTTTYGGVQTAQFPISIYRKWFRNLFIYLIPLAGVTYFPAIAFMGRPDPLGTSRLWQFVSPISGPLFLIISLQVWQIGVRHYRSTGS